MRLIIPLFVVLFLGIVSCNGPKKMLKEAKVYEDGGLREQAYQAYSSIYDQHAKPEALVGMKRIAQSIMIEKFQKAQMECMRGNHEQALTYYDEAFAYANSKSHLQLEIPLSAEEQKAQCKSDYFNSLYDTAEKAVLDENYDEAQRLIQKLRYLDRNNKKVEYLDLMSQIYPKYNSGVKAMELELWRDAYDYFNEVCKLDADFKDVLKLREQCLNRAKYTIAYVPILKSEIDDAIESSVSAFVKQKVLALQSPFIELVERESLEEMLQEQMNSMNAAFDQNDLIEAGKLAGARYIITGELVMYEHKTSPQRGYEKKAYLGNDVDDKKVRYTEYRLGRGIDASFRYKILDAETGKIYASEVIPYIERDNVVWSDFEGDYTRLYPGEWKWQLINSKEDIVLVDQREELMSQFTGRKGPITELEMRMKMMEEIGTKVAFAVKNFKP
jgi:Curli production assembly/transport component CsgG